MTLDATLVLLGLLASTLVNVVLGFTVLLVVRARTEEGKRRPMRPARAPALDLPAAIRDGEAPVTSLSKREAILELLRRGAPRRTILARTGASPGEVDLVLRMEQRAREARV